MGPIQSVADAKEAFSDLRWRDMTGDGNGVCAFAICGGDKETGDIVILLAMEGPCVSPRHFHNVREGWPFRETITILSGKLYGISGSCVFSAGETIDLNSDDSHAPFVVGGGFCLAYYRQPAGCEFVK